MIKISLRNRFNLNHQTFRRTLFQLALIGSLVLNLNPPLAVYAQDSGTTHVVAAGENLSTIAKRYGVSLSLLMSHNNISNPDLIRTGKLLYIPSPVHPSASPTSSTPVSVPTSSPTPGPPSTFTQTTSGTPTANATDRGTATLIPATATNPPPVIGGSVTGYTASGEPVYTVRRGDTLSGIASQFGVTVNNIVARNRLPGLRIYVAQRLIIPIGGSVPTPTATYPSQSNTPIATATPVPAATATVERPTATPVSEPLQPIFPDSTFALPTATSTPAPRLQ